MNFFLVFYSDSKRMHYILLHACYEYLRREYEGLYDNKYSSCQLKIFSHVYLKNGFLKKKKVDGRVLLKRETAVWFRSFKKRELYGFGHSNRNSCIVLVVQRETVVWFRSFKKRQLYGFGQSNRNSFMVSVIQRATVVWFWSIKQKQFYDFRHSKRDSCIVSVIQRETVVSL